MVTQDRAEARFAVVLRPADVTGVVPTVLRRFQHTGRRLAQIPKHHVRPAHVQTSAALDTIDEILDALLSGQAPGVPVAAFQSAI